MILGWAISFGLPALYVYTAGVAIGFHLRVVYGEEPWLARTHAEDWKRYVEAVPRWLV